MPKLKIAIESIMLNEVKFLERWQDSAKDADFLHLTDTGSTDGSVELARRLGVVVDTISVRPFRFDAARNAGLALLPADIDIVINLDCDEVLVPGWRQQLEAAVAANPSARQYKYHYTWSWVGDPADGKPDMAFMADKCHTRHGWRWHGAVHEVLQSFSIPATGSTLVQAAGGFKMEHHPDNMKSRGSYLGLLELAVLEEPHNPRQRMYLAREYLFAGKWDLARKTFTDFLAMPEAVWIPERARAYRYLAQIDDHPERWLLRALAEDPDRRDTVVDLCDFYLKKERWAEAAGMAERALGQQERPGDYMTTAHAYDNGHLRDVLKEARFRLYGPPPTLVPKGPEAIAADELSWPTDGKATAIPADAKV